MHPMEPVISALVGMFALGALGCVVAIPICAYKFFRVLFESDTENEGGAAPAQETPAEPALVPAHPAKPAHGTGPSQSAPPLLSPLLRPRGHRVVPKRNRRPRRTAGRLTRF